MTPICSALSSLIASGIVGSNRLYRSPRKTVPAVSDADF